MVLAEFENLYSNLRHVMRDSYVKLFGDFRPSLNRLLELWDSILIEFNVDYTDYVRSQLIEILPGRNNDSFNKIPFSDNFLKYTYSDKRVKYILIIQYIYFRKQRDLYVADILIELGSYIVNGGDKEINASLLTSIFDILSNSRVENNDIESLFTFIDKYFDIVGDDYYGDIFGPIRLIFKKYYSNNYFNVFDKGLNHYNLDIKEEFENMKDIR